MVAGTLTGLRRSESRVAGPRWRVEATRTTGLLHPLACRLWPAFAALAVASGVQLTITQQGILRAGGIVLAVAGVLLLPDLVRIGLRPPCVILRADGLAGRSRTDRWSVPWSSVTSAAGTVLIGAAGVTVATTGDDVVGRTWLLLPLGSRSRSGRLIVTTSAADKPGEIAAAIEAVAAAPEAARPDLLRRIGADLSGET